MDSNDHYDTLYLNELYKQTEGNTETQVSMFDIGIAIGLEKIEASAAAENLMIQGMAELKTLSGGIGITDQGLEELGFANSGSADSTTVDLHLGTGPILDDSGRRAIETLLAEIKTETSRIQTDYDHLEECIIDIKTIEVQLLSANPKVGIIREVLRSLSATINSPDNKTLSNKLKALLSN